MNDIEKRFKEYKEKKEEQIRKKERNKEEWKKKHKMIVEDHWGRLRWLLHNKEEKMYDWEKRGREKKKRLTRNMRNRKVWMRRKLSRF